MEVQIQDGVPMMKSHSQFFSSFYFVCLDRIQVLTSARLTYLETILEEAQQCQPNKEEQLGYEVDKELTTKII